MLHGVCLTYLGCVLHGVHAGRLLCGGVLHERVVDLRGQGVLEEVGEGLVVLIRLHLEVVYAHTFHIHTFLHTNMYTYILTS